MLFKTFHDSKHDTFSNQIVFTECLGTFQVAFPHHITPFLSAYSIPSYQMSGAGSLVDIIVHVTQPVGTPILAPSDESLSAWLAN